MGNKLQPLTTKEIVKHYVSEFNIDKFVYRISVNKCGDCRVHFTNHRTIKDYIIFHPDESPADIERAIFNCIVARLCLSDGFEYNQYTNDYIKRIHNL